MKKLLYIAFFCMIILSGCEKKPEPIAPASLFQLNNQTTAAGIQIGDSPDDFQKAYGKYTIQVAYDDMGVNYLVTDIEDIPYDDNVATMIANFFIDGKPVSEEELCHQNNVQPTSLHNLLSSPAFLRDHNVIYRYLWFQWNDGIISDIASEELNYNETYETPKLDS